MSVQDTEILINTEKIASINKSTKELKEKLLGILADMSANNKTFVSASIGEFSNSFAEDSKQFETGLQAYIDKLDGIDKYVSDTLELQTELDGKIASSMKL